MLFWILFLYVSLLECIEIKWTPADASVSLPSSEQRINDLRILCDLRKRSEPLPKDFLNFKERELPELCTHSVFQLTNQIFVRHAIGYFCLLPALTQFLRKIL